MAGVLAVPLPARYDSCPAKLLSSPLRSTFFGPSVFKRAQKRRLSSTSALSGKCVAQIASSHNSLASGVSAKLHESIVQLQVGILQWAVDLGFDLSSNDGALSWLAIAVPAVFCYLVATPGSWSGLVDYAYAPLHSLSNSSYNADEVDVGRQIGQGSFGIVYEGYIGRGKRKGSQKKELHVVMKKVKPRSKGAGEMHNAEVHMNYRVKRTAPNACADFLGTTEVSSSQIRGRLSEGSWLVWRYEGDRTLDYYMKQRNFPENVADSILGSKVAGTSGCNSVERHKIIIRKIAAQILTCLRDLHKTGLVHRDVKPLNLILAEDSGTFKLIDLGAAVDLRSGYNYIPDETIIDPNYAAPERHVMPTSTPSLPPDPLCSLVSPLVWLLNTPDRFDMFSAGLILLQMAVKPLRQDVGLQSFNAEFKRAGYDLDVWRRRCRFRDTEFSILDVDGAAGWELVRSMLQPRHDETFVIWPSLGRSRPYADAALRHRFFTGSFVKLPSTMLPSLLYTLPPGNLIPSFALDTLPKLGSGGSARQVATAIAAFGPTVATGALTLGIGWLAFAALKDTAEKSYAVGQSAMEYLGAGGSVFLVYFLFVRPLLEALKKKGSRNTLLTSSSLATVEIGTSIADRDIDNGVLSSRRQLPTYREPGDLAMAELQDQENASDVRSPTQDSSRSRMLLGSGRLKYTKTGLTEAVQNMEVQLASLESAIAAGRLFAQEQQQQIIQMEKLLNHRQSVPVNVARTGSKELASFEMERT